MENELPKCWEIENCGREKGGNNVDERGECVVSKEDMGHSCWAVAGTLCKGQVQGTFAQKRGLCSLCEVYKLYNRSRGTKGKEVISKCSDEHNKYCDLMQKNSENP